MKLKYFGTDGVRGVANKDLSPELAFRVGRAGGYVFICHLTIVISEETGEVSITKDNELIRNMSQSDYLKFLRAQLYKHEPQHRDNLLTKLYAKFGRRGGGRHEQK